MKCSNCSPNTRSSSTVWSDCTRGTPSSLRRWQFSSATYFRFLDCFPPPFFFADQISTLVQGIYTDFDEVEDADAAG